VSLYKGPTGIYEADFRFKALPRLHLSMGTRKKTDAQPRYDAVRRVYREAKGPDAADRLAVIEQLRTGEMSVEALEAMVREQKPLAPLKSVSATAGVVTPSAPTVDAISTEYLDWMDANPEIRRGTWESTRSQLRRFAAFEFEGTRTGDLPWDRVVSRRVLAYQTDLVKQGAAANTITGHVSRIGSLYKWLQRREERLAMEERRPIALIYNPLDRETQHTETSSRERWLTKEEAPRIFEATPPQLLVAPALGLLAGMRIGEILHLRTYVDIDLEIGTIRVTDKQVGVDVHGRAVTWKPKTDNAYRYIPIADDLRPILELHIASYASDDWLMPSLSDRSVPFKYQTFRTHFEQTVKDADLVAGRSDPRGVTFHTLRHTFASWLVMNEVDLYTVAQLLGDTLETVEKTYAHLAPDFKRRAIGALSGIVSLPFGLNGGKSTATETATDKEA
jgi:integrase